MTNPHAAAIPLVVDPVMVAKGGARLIEPEREDLLERARIAEGARPDDPRARELGELIRRFEERMDPP